MTHPTRLLTAIAFALITLPAAAFDWDCNYIRDTFEATKARSGAHYSMAFCAAREGKTDQAFAYLDAALALGFHGFVGLRDDPDFASIRGDVRWAPMLAIVEARHLEYLKSINAELYAMYTADQADRKGDYTGKGIDWSVVGPRDEQRRLRVIEIDKAGALKHSDDYYFAGMIFQHGHQPSDFKQANAYALEAVKRDRQNHSALWLACATEDRYLHSIGKPQIWGTQFNGNDKGVFTMEPFDRAQRTDTERIAWDVPTVAQSVALLDEFNRSSGGK